MTSTYPSTETRQIFPFMSYSLLAHHEHTTSQCGFSQLEHRELADLYHDIQRHNGGIVFSRSFCQQCTKITTTVPETRPTNSLSLTQVYVSSRMYNDYITRCASFSRRGPGAAAPGGFGVFPNSLPFFCRRRRRVKKKTCIWGYICNNKADTHLHKRSLLALVGTYISGE